jgi:arsenate reductase
MKTILFACVHNAGRSQMAAALFNRVADLAKARAISAGTEPGPRVHPEVLEAMRELGVDLSKAKPRRLTHALARRAELLITMGCGEACPVVPGLRRDDWPLEDPKGKPLARVREIRDDVERRVRHLVAQEGWFKPAKPEEASAGSCSGVEKSPCCAPASEGENVQARVVRCRSLEVEFLYLDRTVCERCKGTEEILKEAVEEAKRILGPTGVEVSLIMTHVRSEEQALALGFVSSPTVRLNGRDAAVDAKENPCTSCGEIGSCEITCRVWTWQGHEYSVPPKAMLLDAILRDAYLHPTGEKIPPTPLKRLPENLKKYFRGVRAGRK